MLFNHFCNITQLLRVRVCVNYFKQCHQKPGSLQSTSESDICKQKKRVNDSTRVHETNTILHNDLVTKKLDSRKYALHMYTPLLVNKVHAEYHKRIYLTADNLAWNVSVTNILLTRSSI